MKVGLGLVDVRLKLELARMERVRRIMLVAQTLGFGMLVVWFERSRGCAYRVPRAKIPPTASFWRRGSCSFGSRGWGRARSEMLMIVLLMVAARNMGWEL